MSRSLEQTPQHCNPDHIFASRAVVPTLAQATSLFPLLSNMTEHNKFRSSLSAAPVDEPSHGDDIMSETSSRLAVHRCCTKAETQEFDEADLLNRRPTSTIRGSTTSASQSHL